MKKPAALSAGLVAAKGTAAPVLDMPTRSPVSAAPAAQKVEATPINFKMPPGFVQEFKVYAAAHRLKLNELLSLSFAAYRKQQGD